MLTEYDSRLKNVEHRGHYPVMLKEAVAILSLKDGMDYLDCTFGGGGHSRAILESANCRVTAVDRDPAAAERAAELKKIFPERFNFVRANFSEICKLQTDKGYAGILFDFGVSSFQLDEASRGFSFMREGPLDMRMDESAALTAREVVNTYSYEELRRILFEYGEERYAPAIAKRICQHREQKPIETTLELADIIRSAMPASALREKQHPAKRSFQAIRIAVNDELGELPPMLDAAEENLKRGGRLAVITFHSLEDRLVKNKFRRWATACTCPPEFPVCVCGGRAKAKLITRRPIEANTQELEENRRSRSAHLRVLEKI